MLSGMLRIGRARGERWDRQGLLGGLLVAMLAFPTAAQIAELEEGDDPDAGRVVLVDLDLPALLQSPAVLSDQVEDPMWRIAADPGRRLLQLPVKPRRGTEPLDLTTSAVSVRGGRFLTWLVELPPPPQQTHYDQPAVRPSGDRLPEGAPRFTRRLTVLPDGSVQWKLDRFLPNATLRDERAPYSLKVRQDLFAAFDPGQTPRPTRQPNEDMRAFQMRRQQEERDFRAKANEFRELRRMVLDLPDEFTVRRPLRLWAIYESSTNVSDYLIRGIDDEPWRVSFAQLEALRALAGATDRGGGYQDQTGYDALMRHARALQSLVDSGHVLSQRAVASAIAAGQAVPQARTNDPFARLLRKLVDSEDIETQRITIAHLAATMPPTPVTSDLLRVAARKMDPRLQMLSLRGLLQIDAADPARFHDMLETANRLLADPAGPPAAELLGELLETVRDRPQLVPRLSNAIQFDALPAERRRDAIRTVINQAPVDPLAAGWLNQQLLGSTRPEVLAQTLELLVSARVVGGAVDAEATAAGMLARSFSQMFGPPQRDDRPAMSHRLLLLPTHIALDSPRHSYFRSISSADPLVRQRAWQSLQALTIAPAPTGSPRDGMHGYGHGHGPAHGPASEDTAAVHQLLLDTAVAQRPVPRTLVPFLVRQHNRRRVAADLLRLVIAADEPVAEQAVAALRHDDLPLAETLLSAEPQERYDFGLRLYELADRAEESPISGLFLAADQIDPAVRWFVQEHVAHRLPTPAAWANQVGGEHRLLQLALAENRELATAAAMALAASAGGDARHAREIDRLLAQVPDRSTEALRTEWYSARRQIFTDRLHRSAGTYRLELVLLPTDQPRMDDPFIDMEQGLAAVAGAMPTVIPLGLIELQAEGTGLVLAARTLTLSAPSDHLAIRMENLAELKNFPNPAAAELPLEQVHEPVDLLLEDAGVWRGQFRLPDQRQGQVVLTPVQVE